MCEILSVVAPIMGLMLPFLSYHRGGAGLPAKVPGELTHRKRIEVERLRQEEGGR